MTYGMYTGPEWVLRPTPESHGLPLEERAMSKRGWGSFARSVRHKGIVAGIGCGELASNDSRTDASADVVRSTTSTTNRTDDLMLKFQKRERRGCNSKGDRHGFLVAG